MCVHVCLQREAFIFFHSHSYWIFFSFIFISWRLITLQYCSGFCHTLTWISHGFTCVSHPDPPSCLPPHPIPLGLPTAPALSTCLMHPTWAGDLEKARVGCSERIALKQVYYQEWIYFSSFLYCIYHKEIFLKALSNQDVNPRQPLYVTDICTRTIVPMMKRLLTKSNKRKTHLKIFLELGSFWKNEIHDSLAVEPVFSQLHVICESDWYLGSK